MAFFFRLNWCLPMFCRLNCHSTNGHEWYLVAVMVFNVIISSKRKSISVISWNFFFFEFENFETKNFSKLIASVSLSIIYFFSLNFESLKRRSLTLSVSNVLMNVVGTFCANCSTATGYPFVSCLVSLKKRTKIYTVLLNS